MLLRTLIPTTRLNNRVFVKVFFWFHAIIQPPRNLSQVCLGYVGIPNERSKVLELTGVQQRLIIVG